MCLSLVRLFIWQVAICLTSLSFADVTEKALSATVDKRELNYVNSVSDKVAKRLLLNGDAANLCHRWGLCLEFSAGDFSFSSLVPSTVSIKKTSKSLLPSTTKSLVPSTTLIETTSKSLVPSTPSIEKTPKSLVPSTPSIEKTSKSLLSPEISIKKTSKRAEKPKRYTMLDGRDIFVAHCMSCHLDKTSGAPMLTVSEDWTWRVQSGVDFLVSATIAGKPYRISPSVDKDSDRYVVDSVETVAKSAYDDIDRGCELPRGGCDKCSDAEIIAVVKYMVQAAAEGNENYTLW